MRFLKRLGLVFLVVFLVVGGLAARYAAQRAEHQRLRDAELTRAPVVAPKRARAVPLPAMGAPTLGCVRGVVVDHGKPVAQMQVNVSDAPFAVSGECPCAKPSKVCGCREGLAAVVEQPRVALVEAVKGVLTGDDGRFELCGLAPGPLRALWAEHADGRIALAPAELGPFVAPGAEAVTLEVLRVTPVKGLVLSERVPVVGATVVAVGSPALLARTVKTDTRGRFELSLPLGVSDFIVAAPGRAPQHFERVFMVGGLLVLELVPDSELTVRVVFDDKPVAGATVTLGDELPLVTAADGLARFPVTSTDRLKVQATKGDLVGSVGVQLLARSSRRVDVVLQKGVRVRGVVKDELGQPQVAKVRGLAPGKPLETDDEGRFTSPPLEPGTDVRPTAFREGCDDSPYKSLELEHEDLELTLQLACTETVSGQVVDAEGKPIADALVRLDGIEHHETLTTDATGRISFHQPPGSYQLKVAHDRYRPVEQPLSVPAKDVTVVLDAGGSIAGRVVNERGEGVAGADVTVVPALVDELLREVEGGLPTRVTTDPEGYFEATGILAGRLVVSATADSLGTTVSEVVVLQPAERREGVIVAFERRLDVHGTITDEQRRPVAGARVSWDPADEKSAILGVLTDVVRGRVDSVLKFLPAPTFTDADGRYELHNLPISSVKLSVMVSGFANAEKVAAKGDTVDFTLVRDDGLIRGRVIDEAGHPLPRFEVNGSAFTPEDGRFEVKAWAKDQSVSVSAAGFTRYQAEVKVEGEKDLGDVVMKRGLRLEVEVVDDAGKPIEGARVSANQKVDGDSCSTKPDGRCAISPLLDVETTVKAMKFGFKPVSLTVAPADLAKPVRLTLGVAGGKLKGQAFGLAQRPLPSRTVFVSGEVMRGAITDPEGRFVVEKLPEGPYCASLDVPGGKMFEWAAFGLASAQSGDLLLGPQPGGAKLTGVKALPGRLVMLSGTVGPQAMEDVLNRSAADLCVSNKQAAIVAIVTGEFSIDGVPPGTWSVFFVSIAQSLDKGTVEPKVIQLLPNEVKRFD